MPIANNALNAILFIWINCAINYRQMFQFQPHGKKSDKKKVIISTSLVGISGTICSLSAI